MNSGGKLWNEAKKIIPGGNQLLSKRAEMFLPEKWPAYYSKTKGSEVWDLDGKKYLDMSISGVGCCTLGAADLDVDKAVISAIKAGNMSTLNVPEEIELAELLCEIHPWAEMVRYSRTGGEAMAIAVRIVRAATGKDKILFCGYHGWHDWYLAANLAESTALDGQLLPGLEPAGVPRGLRGTAIPFFYNDLDTFKKLTDQYRGEIAGVVMEPVRAHWPQEGFLETIRKTTRERAIPLVFDEVTSGLRMTSGGIHLKLGIEPDVAVLAKALGNGYPIAAIIGKKEVMEAAQKSFISSTYWTDKIGPVAALATLRKHRVLNVSAHLIEIGDLVQAGWQQLSKRHGIKINVSGIPPLGHWEIETENSPLLHTIIVERMLARGFLTSKAFYATYTHTREQVDAYLRALDEILGALDPHIRANTIADLPHGPVAHSGFKRLA
ncbi:MAG TPA: aminotransferase class III-fold pyridoxal phosphate-dependent enzyme [Dehalococcoidales bacterium]|nr:aminotransferase class III-fold pyridoxal phosphate-dependent enzyme [Dehalococcoidales bacterium]